VSQVSETSVKALLRQHWAIETTSLQVLKAVPVRHGPQFTAGLHAAERLERSGIRAGAPVPGVDGTLLASQGDLVAALLTWVPGEPLSGDTTADQCSMAMTLQAEQLSTMLQFRWAVQADYFARRLFDRDMTGIETMVENEKGLADAQRALGDF